MRNHYLFGTLLLACMLGAGAHAATVVADEVTTTLLAAYASLDRADGEDDVINIVTNDVTLPSQFTVGGSDGLTINGDAEGGTGDGTPCRIVMAANSFPLYIFPDASPTGVFNIRDLVILPDYNLTGAENFGRAGVYFRPRDNMTDLTINLERVEVSATADGTNAAVGAGTAYSASHVHFQYALQLHVGTFVGVSNVVLNAIDCNFIHAYDYQGYLRTDANAGAITVNYTGSYLGQSRPGRYALYCENTGGVTANLTGTEIANATGAAFINSIFTGGFALNFLEGASVHDTTGNVVELRTGALGGPTQLSIQGTPADPVRIYNNVVGIIMTQTPGGAGSLQLGPFSNALFYGNTGTSAIRFAVGQNPLPAGSTVGPFSNLLFTGNQEDIRWDVSGVTAAFADCTFHAPTGVYHMFSSGPDQSAGNPNNLTFTDCIFSGTTGAVTRRPIDNRNVDNVSLVNCGIVTAGPYAMINPVPTGYSVTNPIEADPIYLDVSVPPLADSFDVDNPNYGGAASGAGDLSGWGDFVGGAITEVFVDGNPDSPPNYQTLANAYAALDRNDGFPDVIQMLVDTENLSVQFAATGTDDLTLNGDANNNGPCTLIQTGDSFGIYIQPGDIDGGTFTFRDLVILPDFNRNGAENFGRSGIYFRPSLGTMNNFAANLENVTVTATADGGNTAVAVTDPYNAAHVHWDQALQLHITDYTAASLTNVSLNLSNCDLGHGFSRNVYLRTTANADDFNINLTDCRVMNAGAWNIDAQQVGGVTANLTRVEITGGNGGLFFNDVSAGGVAVNLLEGTEIHNAAARAVEIRTGAIDGPLAFTMDGTPAEPVVLRDNPIAVLVDQTPAGAGSIAFGPFDNVLFYGNTLANGSGIRLNTPGNDFPAGSSFGPFTNLLFADNEEHIRLGCQSVTAAFSDCTFHAPRSVYHFYTENGAGTNNLTFTDCVFSGNTDGLTRGINNTNDDTIAFVNCALVEDGPYRHAWSPPYAGNNISDTAPVSAGPMYADVSTPPVAASFDVRNPNYGGAAAGAGDLSGWGDYAPGVLPSVSIDSPGGGASFNEGVDVTIEASASDDGSVAKVEFFNGATLLGEDTSSPFEFTILAAPPGNYSVTAVATDNEGLYQRSAPVDFSVIVSVDSVTVDGVGATSVTYATIADAYAALTRSNGTGGVINIVVDSLTETARTDIGGSDSLIVNGDADGNGIPCTIVQSTPGAGQFFIWLEDAPATLTIRDMVLLPQFVSGADDARYPFEMRVRDNAQDQAYRFSNIIVTAVDSGATSVTPDTAFEDAALGNQTHWRHACAFNWAAAGTSNIRVDFIDCIFAHSGDDMFGLRVDYDAAYTFDGCLLTRSGDRMLDMENTAGLTVNLRDTEVSFAGSYAAYFRNASAPGSSLNLLEGSYIHDNLNAARPAILLYMDGSGPTRVSMQGTPGNPVRFENNKSYALYTEFITTGTELALGPFEDVLFTSNTRSAIGFTETDNGTPAAGAFVGPFEHCLFAANGITNGHILWAVRDAVSTFTECTFANPAGVYQQYHRWGGGNTMTYIDCIFSGTDTTRGASYVVDNADTIAFRNCALVTQGPDAMIYRYYNAGVNQPAGPASVTETNVVVGDPQYVGQAIVPVDDDSFDVGNRAYDGLASEGGPLTGWGDYGYVTAVGDWWPMMH